MNTQIRNTLPSVPKQTKPQMEVRSFRIPKDAWAAFVKRCEREGQNPTEVVRELVADYAEDD